MREQGSESERILLAVISGGRRTEGEARPKFTPCWFNHDDAEYFVSIFRHLKLQLLTQLPFLNDEKYVYL